MNLKSTIFIKYICYVAFCSYIPLFSNHSEVDFYIFLGGVYFYGSCFIKIKLQWPSVKTTAGVKPYYFFCLSFFLFMLSFLGIHIHLFQNMIYHSVNKKLMKSGFLF